MLKSLAIIKIISDYLRDKHILKQDISSISEIYDFFVYLQNHKYKFFTLYIYNYLFNFISSNEVAKRKTSARVFEDLLAVIFNAKVADTQIRSNLSYEVSDYFINVKDKIASNRREKADVVFENAYSFSVKTLIAKNKEINMGSFEKRVLFDGLKVDIYYKQERKSNDGASVGSIPQFLKLLTLIETLSSYEKFREKFNKMVDFIYSDDLLLTVKNNDKMELYFFSGAEIIEIFKTHSQNKDDFLKIVNRYEGNSLRIDRTPFIQNCTKHISLDFSYLKSSCLNLINDFDLKLHKGYFDYFNDTNSKTIVFRELDKIFDNFDLNYEELK